MSRATAVDATFPRTVAEIPAYAHARYGARTAVHFPGAPGLTTLTYAALDARTASLARRLSTRVAAGDHVVLAAANSVEWLIALFGIARAGAVAVPVDPELDDERREAILSEVRPAAVIADAERRPAYEQASPWSLPIESLAASDPDADDGREAGVGADASEQDATGSERAVAPDDLACVLYTAGTTGRPKGVMLTHANLLANVGGVLEAVDFTTEDRVFVVLPLFHAFPLTTGCLSPVAAGVRIELEAHPRRVVRRFAQDHPTIVIGVPELFESLVRQVRRGARGRWRGIALRGGLALNRALVRATGVNAARVLFRPVRAALGGRLRFAVSGGAPLAPAAARDAYLLGVPVLQGYGLSEAGPVVSVQRFDHRRFWYSRAYWRRMGCSGRPLPNVEVRVLRPDAEGEGELLVGGPSVMRGYLGHDEETASALEGGWLHTGDLARIDDEGEVWITGRAKLAVSTPGGKLVHLEHIERALASADAVAQVVVREETAPRWRLAALVFPAVDAVSPDADVDAVERAVRAGVREAGRALAPHERVSAIELTDAPLPITRLGKVRRDAVPARVSFDIDAWRARAGGDRGATGAATTPAPQVGRAPYALPAGFVLRWLVSAVLWRRRDLAADARRLFAGRTPPPRAVDVAHVPASGPFVIAMNHYERPGMRVWWPAMVVSEAVAGHRSGPSAVRWLITDRFGGYRLGPLRIPGLLTRVLLALIAHVYDQIPVARPTAMSGTRSGALRRARRELHGDPTRARAVGITPEAERGSGPALAVPASNAGMALALLSDGRVPIVPVAVYEEDEQLVARFGRPFTLAWESRAGARRRRHEYTERVMRALAELLPAELRGPYGAPDARGPNAEGDTPPATS